MRKGKEDEIIRGFGIRGRLYHIWKCANDRITTERKTESNLKDLCLGLSS